MKLEPLDFESSQCTLVPYNDPAKETQKLSPGSSQFNANAFQGRRSELESSNTNYGLCQQTEHYLQRSSVSDEMPTLIPIRSSRGVTNGTISGLPGRGTQKQLTNSRPAVSDSGGNIFCGTAAHAEVFVESNSSISVSEINRKLNILLANQNKIMLQNDRILSQLNATVSSSQQRGLLEDALFSNKEREGNVNKGAELSEERSDIRAARVEASHRMYNSAKGGSNYHSRPASYSDQNYFSTNCELELGPPPRKSRIVSATEGRSTGGSHRSTPRSPSRDFTVGSSVASMNSFQSNHASAQMVSANSVLPLYANQCNMAVYVVRGGEEPNQMTVLPVQCNQTKSGSSQSKKSNSILSAQPALLYNESTRQYEPSYVTGIAHLGPGNTQPDLASASRNGNLPSSLRSTSERPPSHPVGSIPNDSDVHPNITNVVSLRKRSVESASTNGERCQNVTESHLEAVVSSAAQLSSPPSPIIIEEDIKPTALPSQEELLHSQLRSFSMRNYAVQLMRALFRPHELMHRSVYENSERKGLDKKRLQQIKEYVFQIYPTPNKERSLAWIECISAMNEAIRAMK